MRLTLKTELLPLLLVLAAWGLMAWYWPQLPDPMPTHWGPDGRPDDWMPRIWGALIGPLAATFVYLVMTVSPYIDPRSRNWTAFAGIYPILKAAVGALMLFITYMALSAAAAPEESFPVSRLLVGLGLVFVVLGGFLPKLRSNFFVGIRTPWTLSSEEVWIRTHRLGGWLMILLGGIITLSAWLAPSAALGVVLGATGVYAVICFGYSYWLYRRLTRD